MEIDADTDLSQVKAMAMALDFVEAALFVTALDASAPPIICPHCGFCIDAASENE